MFPFTKRKDITHIDEMIIIVDGQRYKKHDHNREWEELKIIKIQAETIFNLTKPERRRPIFALTTIINNQKFIIMGDIVLSVGAGKTGVFTLLDNKTLKPVSDASFTNQAVGVNTNPDAATFEIDPSNPSQPTAKGIAPGSGSVVFTTDASYTDPGDGSSQSGSFSITKNFTVVASPDGVSLDVVFS
jgi:hypothetical protein